MAAFINICNANLRLQAQTNNFNSLISFGVSLNCEVKCAGYSLHTVGHEGAVQADGMRLSRVALRVQLPAAKPGACFGCVY